MKSQNTECSTNSQFLNWFSLCIFKCKPRRLQMGISCVFSTKCGNRPSCQAHVSRSQAGSRAWRQPSRAPPFPPLALSRWCQRCCESLDNAIHKTAMRRGHGCVPRHSAQSSSGQSFCVAVIGGAVRVQEQAQSVSAFSVIIGWKKSSSVVFLIPLSFRVTAVSVSQWPHLHAPRNVTVMWLWR